MTHKYILSVQRAQVSGHDVMIENCTPVLSSTKLASLDFLLQKPKKPIFRDAHLQIYIDKQTNKTFIYGHLLELDFTNSRIPFMFAIDSMECNIVIDDFKKSLDCLSCSIDNQSFTMIENVIKDKKSKNAIFLIIVTFAILAVVVLTIIL